ncbi:antibiotic biosynthesis monooxygenase [Thalassotalea litorea]|uniref:Antibiotic biosynthesis monooxygenase n=1 Tax=Thalassotalea litorea TaxID=2020715 RepID=A0A5R9IJ28_9GAMM|nr:antibiotic biosynthesis monooxygenase [Thalassotalea litorea]TLU61287.1 antibiotic biosynthesis monooxygenase [Thalassotalea litorea]
MYAVIFTATMKLVDDEYLQMANQLRELAFSEFGCLEFTSSTEGEKEIAISYWPTKQHILNWKQHPLHQTAQALGKSRWYQNYRVQVVKIEHEYGNL